MNKTCSHDIAPIMFRKVMLNSHNYNPIILCPAWKSLLYVWKLDACLPSRISTLHIYLLYQMVKKSLHYVLLCIMCQISLLPLVIAIYNQYTFIFDYFISSRLTMLD